MLAGLLSRRGHPLGVDGVEGRRLLAEDMLARLEGSHRQRHVELVRRENRDRIDVRAHREHLVEARIGLSDLVDLGRAGAGLRIGVGERDDLGSGGPEPGDVVARHAAGADDSYLDAHSATPSEEREREEEKK
jgi:hypothetical protein